MGKKERISNLETRVNFLFVEVQRLSKEIENINRMNKDPVNVCVPITQKDKQNWIPMKFIE